MKKPIAMLGALGALCLLMTSGVADAQATTSRQNCNWWNNWLPNPSTCPQGKYGYTKFGYNYSGASVEVRWNYYAACPECTGQDPYGKRPRWRREYTTVGATTIAGAGTWYLNDRTYQPGFNFYSKKTKPVTAKTRISYEATSMSSAFYQVNSVSLN